MTPALTFHMIAGAPDPVAPFSHAVEAQTRQVIAKLRTVLGVSGLAKGALIEVDLVAWRTPPAAG